MRRDCFRGAATLAFIRYGELRGKTADEYREDLKRNIIEELKYGDPAVVSQKVEADLRRYEGFFDDLYAVEEVFGYFLSTNRGYIVDAVRAVYMAYPRGNLSHKDTVYRVRHHAMAVPVSEKQVYKWLEMARALYAKRRGLALETPPGFVGSKW